MSATPRGLAPAVVKLGGSRLDALDLDARQAVDAPDPLDALDEPWWDDLAGHARRRPLILVHGWSRPLRRLDPRHGRPGAMLRDRYGNESRWTTPEVLDDIKTVGSALGADIVARLTKREVTADHLLGSDGLISAGPGERLWWQGNRLVERENLVGPPTGVNTGLLERTRPGHVCVVTPLARNAAGQEVNTDADRAAAAIAGAAGAQVLVLLTDVPHLRVDGSPVRHITREAVIRLRDTVATGGMRKKLRAACEALDRRVPRVVIGNDTVTALLATRTGTLVTRA
ncbi:acetylglutamate kinase [Streptomyces sp. NPDC005865]|uniref:amino acid kinase family protein n=1 Tax=Streptomyces sp. NPDC005865 TaxID=3155453 RepID=UPI0033EF5C6A